MGTYLVAVQYPVHIILKMRLGRIYAYRLLLNDSFIGIFWKCARIGERLSPYVSICCVIMAVSQARSPTKAKKLMFYLFRSQYSSVTDQKKYMYLIIITLMLYE
jgi:hypothetical protein